MNKQTIEEPSRGGSYVRNADGTLTRTGGTESAPLRDKRETADSAAPTDTPAPADAADATQE